MSGHRAHWNVLVLCFATVLAASSSLHASSPDDAAFNSQMDQGRQALQAGKYGDAISAFKKATKARPSCADCYLSLAVAYMQSGQIEDGIKSCDRAIAVATDDPTRAEGHNLKGNLLLGGSGEDKKRLAAAESEYRAATQLQGKIPVYHVNLARALLRQSKDDEAKKSLEACLVLNPDEHISTQARLMLADPRRGRSEFAPDFELQTLQGKQFSLKQMQGKVLVMDFWATWCPPCRASVPELKTLTQKYPTEKLVLISVSADDDDQAWRDFIAKKNMDWPQYRDTDHKVIDAFGVKAFPTYLVVDGDGIVRQRITGLDPMESVVHRLKDTLRQMPQLEGELRK